MDGQLAELRRQLEEEKRRRQEEQRLREEERRRREEAEASAEHSRPHTLLEHLKACHRSFHALTVVTDKTSTTQGNTTDPTGRQFPRHIVPWDDFITGQDEIWERFSVHPDFHSRRTFPTSHQLDYVCGNLRPISSENGLRDYARETIENHVRTLIEQVYEDEQLRDVLGLRGKVVFESHTNVGDLSETTIEEEMERMTVAGPSTPIKTRGRARGQGQGRKADKGKGRANQGGSKSSVRRRGGSSDQFCILEMPDGGKAAIMLIEYKAPHKFSLDNVIAGLDGEIRPAEDVIGKDGKSFEFLSKCLAAAVITQLFSDMIRKGVRWGYICTGEANVFLHIPDEPSVVYYHLSIPKLDCKEDDEYSPYRTAVAEASAFVLRAMHSEAPSQSWRDEAEKLSTWPQEYIDVLKDIPPTPSESGDKGSEYQSKFVSAYLHSPMVLRRRKQVPACKELGNDEGSRGDRDGHDDGDERAPGTPSPAQDNRRGKRGNQGATPKRREASRGTSSGADKRNNGNRKRIGAASRPRIEDRPYCTHQCLLGLAHGGPLDRQCPNLQDHRTKHIKRETFLHLVRAQLAKDRGRDADCKPLYTQGSRGALFKIRLSSHGYTFVAKGMEEPNLAYLRHEHRVYEQVRPLQGMCVPVCLGAVDLERPYYYDCGLYVRMLFLSWAGRPVFHYINRDNEAHLLDKATEALHALHKFQVLHDDAEPRNMLFDESCDRLMLVDFERAKVRVRQPLGMITPNRKRKRKGKEKKTVQVEDFDVEPTDPRDNGSTDTGTDRAPGSDSGSTSIEPP
ncbi:hypothetical protein H2199_008749 [Coniosporium tulheliwenetii]|uniref:Uncharacterized protein n=1 Tax=Coniosporium tulheliwenetii TaxID=3383036 RepID=A0ACC2YHQ7_9PEZI|nr:hypothetical protein H2199_008749 [Cladosporium sp. JES 115]